MRSIALSLLGAATLAACSSKDRPSTDGNVGGTLVIAALGDAADIFPPLVNDGNGRLVQETVFDHLAEIGPDMNTLGDKGFTPRLARSWSWAPDSLSIAFALDPRARWHDGTPVVARDVQYAFRAFTDSKVASPAAQVLTNVDSVTVRDSATAVVWFKRRTPEQFYDVVYNMIPLPEHVYGAIPLDSLRTSEKTRTLVGSGRFRFVKWEPKVRLELMADTAHYRGRAKLDRVILTPVGDPSAAMTQVLSGAADFMENFPPDQLATLDSSKVAGPIPFAGFGYVFMGINTHARKNAKAPHPVLSDIRVRRALAMGMDRTAMLTNVFGRTGRISYGPFPRTLPAADTTLKLPPYDTTAARAQLDSAGWTPGADGIRVKGGRKLQLHMIYPATSAQRRRYAVLIQEQLRRIGVQIDIDVVDNVTYMSRANDLDYDVQLAGYSVDPSVSGAKQNWTTAAIGAGGLNSLYYSNRNVDALLDTATVVFDPAKSRSASSRAYQAIIDDVPAVFLYDIIVVEAVNRRITTAPMRPDGWFANLADWSVPADKRIDRDRIGLAPAKP